MKTDEKSAGSSPPESRQAFWLRYTLSCSAATVAETATYPLDIVKTRLQIQGEQSVQRCLGSTASCSAEAFAKQSTKVPPKLGFVRLTAFIGKIE